MKRIIIAVSLVVAACGGGEPDSDVKKSALTGTDQELCLDPIHCATSQNAVGGLVSKPVLPETWRPAPLADPTDETDIDADNDGVSASHDCDDNDPSRYPGAYDVSCDGIDQDCDGVDSCDHDKDGFVDGIDCAPYDPKITDQCRPKDEPLKTR